MKNRRKDVLHRQDTQQATQELQLSELKAKGSGIRELAYANAHLVPLDIAIDDDIAVFSYDTTDLFPLHSIKTYPLSERYRVLMNVAELYEVSQRYDFSLSPDNLFYDRNLLVKALKRDAAYQDDFLTQYQCLCGHIIQKKYDFEDYMNGGLDLLKKNKLLTKVYDRTTVAQIAELFKTLYDEEIEYIANTKRIIGKGWLIALIASLSIITIIAIAGTFFSLHTLFVQGPYDLSVINAANAYIGENFDKVVDELSPYDITLLNKQSRFILANSYVVSESLTNDQKRTIRAGLNLKTDDNIINYWIMLGRERYDDALDLALRLNDDELRLYALLKQEVATEQDINITGAEKAAKIESINKEIESLKKKLEEAKAKAAEETDAK